MDLQIEYGYITDIIEETDQKQELLVSINGEIGKAICFPELTKCCQIDDRVVLNTTAVSLSLGTGGYHFVIANLTSTGQIIKGKGHIMKLRYTPSQGRVLSVEESDSPYHQVIQTVDSIEGLPVIVGSLHSMLTPIALGFNEIAPGKRLVYLMSDGAALPLVLSNQVRALVEAKLVSSTITFNHAFGGDFETVNVYSGLLTAKHVCNADAAVILMGPGVVGTNTTWGTTALEQGVYLNAVDILNGLSIAVPRISFADSRTRHLGISHHSITSLTKIVRNSCEIPLPHALKNNEIIKNQIGKFDKHKLHWVETENYKSALVNTKLPMNSMGRGFQEDPLFFTSAFAAGLFAGIKLQNKQGASLKSRK